MRRDGLPGKKTEKQRQEAGRSGAKGASPGGGMMPLLPTSDCVYFLKHQAVKTAVS
jgi:hypothetical protein